MDSGLLSEFSTFCELMKKLRLILKETQRCFRDINAIGRYEGSKYTDNVCFPFKSGDRTFKVTLHYTTLYSE